MPACERILLLGGTAEAVHLAKALTDQGHLVITSLGGRTKKASAVAGKVRIGGFGGAHNLAEWIVRHKIDRVIDATHPFAQTISNNARVACRIAGIPLQVHSREPWARQTGDQWINVDGLAAAASAIPVGANVFLAIGSQHIGGFSDRDDVKFVIRMIDPPQTPINFSNHVVVLGKPSPSRKQEAALLSQHQISHIVCRNSGGSGAYAKIAAARELAIPVIMIRRPQ